VINNSGELIFPAPAIPYGYMRYDVPAPLTSLQLVGKGAPSYNSTATWGETLQRNDIRITENFANGIRTSVLSVVPGVNGKITLPMSFMNDTALVVGNSVQYNKDTAIVDSSYTIQTILPVANVLEITFAETIPAGAAGDGIFIAYGPSLVSPLAGQLMFDKAEPQMWAWTDTVNYHGVCIATIPMTEYVDMGSNKITMLADSILPQDAVNQRTADRIVVALAKCLDRSTLVNCQLELLMFSVLICLMRQLDCTAHPISCSAHSARVVSRLLEPVAY
jgi:hypothetical protein